MTACHERNVLPLEAVHDVERELRAAEVPSPRVDAEILVGEVLGLPRSALYSSRRELTDPEAAELRGLLDRRVAREPLAYILGEWGFRRLLLKVDGRALIPRPETEVLVDRCLRFLADLAEPRVLDVGVGSGAIALALADEHPGARVIALDRSPQALSLARENLTRASVNGRVTLLEGDLLADVDGSFDLVVSNPPYVSAAEYEHLQPEIRLYEPYEALVGLGVGARIAEQSRSHLRRGGKLALECGDGQAGDLVASLQALGYSDVLATPDLAGRDRVVEATWPR
jgi:release factor glutamine methyltransferase